MSPRHPINHYIQTHLNEINLPTGIKGHYTYGITVDLIRISKSLKDFGTPDDVAAKIFMAELRRDRVLDLTLAMRKKMIVTVYMMLNIFLLTERDGKTI